MEDPRHNTIEIARLLDETSVGHVHYLPEVGSTNDVALERVAQTPPDDSELVLAGRQLRGKGRGENRWWSSEGSLTFSLITPRMPIARERTPGVSLTAGLAICQAAERAAPAGQTRLKWPNDIYLQGRKAGGILIESPAGAVDRFVVGVGINVNNQFNDAPTEVAGRAISLGEAAGRPLCLTDVLIDCLRQFDVCLAMLVAGDPLLPELWRAYSLLVGRRVRLATPGHVLEGLCTTIADDGALLLDTPQGPRECYGGVVEWFE